MIYVVSMFDMYVENYEMYGYFTSKEAARDFIFKEWKDYCETEKIEPIDLLWESFCGGEEWYPPLDMKEDFFYRIDEISSLE